MLKKITHFTTLFILLVLALSACRKKVLSPVKAPVYMPAFFDARPTQEHISYLYAPGMMNTELGIARYCPEFTASTGEKVSCKSGGQVIGQPHSAVVFPEIDLRKPTYFTINPITWFINGLRQDLAPLAQRFMQDNLNFIVQDNPDSPESIVNYSFKFGKANLGQKNDIKTLHAAYNKHIQNYPNTGVVLYGDSRGAATIFNFIALHKPTQVKAAILDGIFDSIPHTVKHFVYTDKEQRAENRLYSIVRFVMGSYKHDGITQRETADLIDDTVPLLLVISLKDGLVAPQSAFYLYNRLRARGHQKVHLLVLKKALHPAYMISDAQDKKMYETVVHAFYKKYNLPHNKALAQAGQKDFAATQPTAEYLKTYKLPTCPLCDATHAENVSAKKIKRTIKK